MRICSIASLFLIVTSSAGCTEPAPNTISFQRQRLSGVSYRTAFDAAEQAVRERFRVSDLDAGAGVIRGESRRTAGPVDPDPRRARLLSDPLGVSRQVRRLAEVRVRRDGPEIELFCRVRVQENQADTVRMLRREYGVRDQPTDTPADRDAGTTEAQNAVWRDRRRDRDMERSLLASIREFIDKSAVPGHNP